MDLPPELAALRLGVALAELEPVARVRVVGPGVAGWIGGALACRTPPREARASPALLLRDDGRVLADALVVGEAGGALVLAEGIATAELAGRLRARTRGEATIEPLQASHALVSLQGPFAWELLGALAGPDVAAAPFHTAFPVRRFAALAIRAGTAGEFAYHLLVPRAHEPALRAAIEALAERFALRSIDRAALSLAALEQGSFDVEHGAVRTLTPIELQLQWRIDYAAGAPGIAALRALRASGEAGRVTWCVGPALPGVGAPVRLRGRAIGTIVHAARSPALAAVVALALLERRFAHPGLSVTWTADGADAPARTVSPPLLACRSLFVHPYEHRFAAREAVAWPPLVRVWPPLGA